MTTRWIRILFFLTLITFSFHCKSSDTSDESVSVQDREAMDSDSQGSLGNMKGSDPDESTSRGAGTGKKGCIKGDCVNGFGVYVYENGDTYTGMFKDDKRNGEGSFAYSNGETFKGSYQDDMRTGKGLYTFSNGDKFAGEFQKGEIAGQGVYTFKDGKVLTGTFSGNGSSGSGTIIENGKPRNCKIENRKLACE